MTFEVLSYAADYAFDVCKATSTRRNLEIQIFDLEHTCISLHDLSLEVCARLDLEHKASSPRLNLAGRLDLGVLEATRVAGKGHDDDLSKVGYLREQ